MAKGEWESIIGINLVDGMICDLYVTFERGARRVTEALYSAQKGEWLLNDHWQSNYVIWPVITHFMPMPDAPAKIEIVPK